MPEERDVPLEAATVREKELDRVLLHGGVGRMEAPHGLELPWRERVVAAGVVEGGVDVLAIGEEHPADELEGVEHGVHAENQERSILLLLTPTSSSNSFGLNSNHIEFRHFWNCWN